MPGTGSWCELRSHQFTAITQCAQVEMLRKFMLTSLIIFGELFKLCSSPEVFCAVRPDTTAQLGAGFLICMGFVVLQINLLPFQTDKDNNFQFYSMLSTLLMLFSGDYPLLVG